eukprot:753861-Hanusia_phi.AAC.6
MLVSLTSAGDELVHNNVSSHARGFAAARRRDRRAARSSQGHVNRDECLSMPRACRHPGQKRREKVHPVNVV